MLKINDLKQLEGQEVKDLINKIMIEKGKAWYSKLVENAQMNKISNEEYFNTNKQATREKVQNELKKQLIVDIKIVPGIGTASEQLRAKREFTEKVQKFINEIKFYDTYQEYMKAIEG